MKYYLVAFVCGMEIKSKPYPSRFEAMRARSELIKISLQGNNFDLDWQIVREE